MRKVIVPAAAALAALAAASISAGSGGPLLEPAYYDGREVEILVPSGASENPNQVHSACFALGPDMSKTGREQTAYLYALFVPGATQYACPDGSRRHDHVLAAGPGDPGYSAAWTVVRVTPGPSFAVAKMPYTTEADVLAGAAAGELVLTNTGFSFRAPVAR